MTSRPAFQITPAPPRAGTVDFISGRTRLYGIVGYPIAQARSPQTLTWELRRRGIDAVLVPMEIAPDDFDALFPQLLKLGNLDGLVVTVPHKVRVLAHLDRVGPTARLCGGASVLARCKSGAWIGEMFDGRGCVAAIEQRGVPVAGLAVQLLGAGGAGAAIAAELASGGVAALRIVDPDAERAQRLCARLREAFPAVETTAGRSRLDDIDLLINASPVGMLAPEACPIGDAAIPANVVVFDAVMDPDRTRLIAIAEASGCTAIRGREMLDAQIGRACDFMLGAREGEMLGMT
jgi:shikimate dehydrogenase